ncbi:MAG: hypothetical protein JNM27_10730 [Leptospirales bacterium]|nr:hypothetical protein [Leptospirales bacterium]
MIPDLHMRSSFLRIALLIGLIPTCFLHADPAMERASMNGKYTDFKIKVRCPADRESYGEFHEYGFYETTSWCGQPAADGYWVYVAPDWYIWGKSNGVQQPETPPEEARPNDMPPEPAGNAPGYKSSPLYRKASAYCEANKISVYSYHERYTGNTDSIFAPFVRTRDGGMLIVGTLGGDQEGIVVKLDAKGTLVWKKLIKKAGRPAIEVASAIEASDGSLYVNSQVYYNPSTMSQIWILKLDSAGKQIWEYTFRGFGNDNNPAARRLQLIPNDGIKLLGHIYPTLADMRNEKSAPWQAELNANGKIVSDVSGKPGEEEPADPMEEKYPD